MRGRTEPDDDPTFEGFVRRLRESGTSPETLALADALAAQQHHLTVCGVNPIGTEIHVFLDASNAESRCQCGQRRCDITASSGRREEPK